MPRKPKAYVLDSWAVLSYFHDEPAGEQVETIIADAREDGIPIFISVVNAAEVWYITARRRSEADADSGIRVLREFGIHFVEADWNLGKDAGYFKSRNKMSFADCFAAALAKQRKALLVTGDKEFKQVQTDITINWLTNSRT
jgi:predicted nucleic acid-binding protein